MALVECMDCKKEISKNAEKCPHCGAANAHLTAQTLLGCFGLIVVILVIGGFMSLCSTEKSDEEKEAARKEAEIADTECRKDAACWGEKHLRTAARHCKPKIERFAQYSFNWTTGFLEPEFARWILKDRDTGALVYFGDKIQFQNGFGAMQNHYYRCDYDPINEVVLDVEVWPGFL